MSNSRNVKQPNGDYDENSQHTDNSATQHAAPPSLRVEFVVIDGDEGRKLHAIQSQAVYEALLWLYEHRGTGNSKENA